jgi:hypothetical protein
VGYSRGAQTGSWTSNQVLQSNYEGSGSIPGLIRERTESRHSEPRQAHEQWIAQPFRYKEKTSEGNLLAEFFEVPCTEKTGSVKKAKSKKVRKERGGHDSDGDEDEGGLGENHHQSRS